MLGEIHMELRGDFHLHTTASDGKLSPTELVRLAKKEQIGCIAVTDHDTISGLGEALKAGEQEEIQVIPGIELSTLHQGESIHILGYFKGDAYKSVDFRNWLQEMIDYREWRGRKIVENLKIYYDIELQYEKILEKSKGVIARPHIAEAILEAGYDYTWDKIFDTVLNKDSKAYVPNKKVTIQEGIRRLKEVNALVVLAHPVLIRKTDPEDLMQFDFDGVEAIYTLHDGEKTDFYRSLAARYGKLITAGSDYHGLGKGDTKHGYIGAVTLSGKPLEAFLSKVKGLSLNE